MQLRPNHFSALKTTTDKDAPIFSAYVKIKVLFMSRRGDFDGLEDFAVSGLHAAFRLE